jgi:NADPH-dependent curcumin reductase CurA
MWSIGEVMPAGAVGEVVKSKVAGFDPGDIVTGSGLLQELEWAEYTIASPEQLRQVETGSAPVSTSLGVLGMPGRTAYFGMFDVGMPKPGDTIVVSGAAGAVGSVAGQLASMVGSRVIGTAGSDEKVEWITDELGFDVGLNYRTIDDMDEAISSACPDGIDVYFDNVGGSISDAVIRNSNTNARIAVCGQIAHYNEDEEPTGPRVIPMLQYGRIENFNVAHYTHRYEEANTRLRSWVTSGKISYRESITEGIENAPDALIGLFEGDNIGKQLVKVAEG